MEQVESKSEAEEQRLHAEIAKCLASCSKKVREKAVEILKVLLQSTPRISDEALRRLWKALFFCVWRADKQPVQAHLVRNLASLISSLGPSLSRRYFQFFLETIRREWAGIDHLRLDKFHLMITRFLSAVFIFLRDHNWELELVRNYMRDLLAWSLLSKDTYPAVGVNLHFVDVFLKELIAFLPVENETIDPLFEPFFKILATCSQKTLVNRVKTGVFDEILRAGRQYLNLAEVKFSMDNETAHTFCESNMDDAKNRTEQLGFIFLRCGMHKRLFEIAEAEETPQANREVIYAVAAEFQKLEKQMPVLLTAHGTMLQMPRVRTVCTSHELINGQLEDSASHGLGNERGNADKKGKKRKRNRNKSRETNGEEGDKRRRKIMKKTQNVEESASTVDKVLVSNDVTSEINENSKHDVLPLEDVDKERNNRKRKRKKSQETNREEGDQRKTQNLEEPASTVDKVLVSNDVTSEVNENSKHDDVTSEINENSKHDVDKEKNNRKRKRKKSQETNRVEGDQRKTQNLEEPASTVHKVFVSNDVTSEINENSKHDVLLLEDVDKEKNNRKRKKSQETNREEGDQRKTQNLEERASTVDKVLVSNDVTSEVNENSKHDVYPLEDADKKRNNRKRKRKKSQETNREEGDQRKTQNLEELASALHEVHFSNDVTSEVNENLKHDGFSLENLDKERKKRKWKRMRKESQKTNGENEKLECSTSQGLEKERKDESHKGRKKITRGKRMRKKSQETNGENGILEDSTSQGLEKERKDESHKGKKKTRRGKRKKKKSQETNGENGKLEEGKRKKKKSQETNGENGKLEDSTSQGLEKERKDESPKGKKKIRRRRRKRRGKKKRKNFQETNGENGKPEDSTSQGSEKERNDKSQGTNGKEIKQQKKKSQEHSGESRNNKGLIPFTLFL